MDFKVIRFQAAGRTRVSSSVTFSQYLWKSLQSENVSVFPSGRVKVLLSEWKSNFAMSVRKFSIDCYVSLAEKTSDTGPIKNNKTNKKKKKKRTNWTILLPRWNQVELLESLVHKMLTVA
jgi:hypothetical protein